MATSPLTFVAQAPDLIAHDLTGDSALTANGLRYAPMPGSRENRWVNTFEDAVVGLSTLNAVGATPTWMPEVPIDPNAAGGGPGVELVLTDITNGRLHTANDSVANFIRFRERDVHCLSIEVFHQAAADRSMRLEVQEVGGPNGTGGVSELLPVPPNQWTRVSLAYTPSRKPTGILIVYARGEGGWVNGETLWLRRPMFEPGVSTPGEWFSGSSSATTELPGPKWIDPRTGYAVDPCRGISLANAAWLMQGSNAQRVINPYGTIDTTGRTFTNCSGARTTDYAIQGPASIRLTATGANARDTASISAPFTGTFVLHAIVINEQAAARTCRLIVNGVAVTDTTVAIPAYGEAQLRGSFAVTASSSYAVGVEWTTSATGETFITEYLGCLGHAQNQGAHTVFPIPALDDAGTIVNPAYSWAGTPHASTSSGGGTSLYGGILTPRARSRRGAAIVRLSRFGLTTGSKVAVKLGNRDAIHNWPEQLVLEVGPTDAGTTASAYTAGTPYGTPATVAGFAIPGDTEVDVMIEWDGDLLAIERLGLWRVDGSRTTQPATGNLRGGIDIGVNDDAFESFDGTIVAVAVASRPLTMTEKERIHARKRWTLAMVDDLQPGIPLISTALLGRGRAGGTWDFALTLWRADRSNTFLEDITADLQDGYVDWDDGRIVKGGGEITLRRRGLLSSMSDLVAPVLVMTREDGTVRSGQLGLYVISMPAGVQDMDQAEGRFQLRDVTQLLAESVLRKTYNIAAGTARATALATIAAQVGLGRLQLPANGGAIAAADSVRKGTNRLEIFNRLCRAVSWQDVSADMYGRLAVEIHRRIRDVEPVATYTGDDFLSPPEDQAVPENFANVVVVRNDTAAGSPIVAVAVNDDPTDPVSTAALGREIKLPDVTDPNLATQQAADDLAARLLEKAGSWERVVKARVLANPQFGVNRSVDVQFHNADSRLDGRYWARKWRIDLTGNGSMELELNRVVRRRS